MRTHLLFYSKIVSKASHSSTKYILEAYYSKMFKLKRQSPPPSVSHQNRAHICKCFRRPGIDSEDSIPPAHVAWRAVTTNRVVVLAGQAGNQFLGSLKGLQIRAQIRFQICTADKQNIESLSSCTDADPVSEPRNRFQGINSASLCFLASLFLLGS
jgi:hypothetical protein